MGMSHSTFAAAVAAGSCSQSNEANNCPTLDINLSTTRNAPIELRDTSFMTGQEFETPKCSEKRARLESFPITSLENAETNPQNFEYIPDSDALQKTCLSPCGKASLTSAVVGSPVAGKTSAGTMNRGDNCRDR